MPYLILLLSLFLGACNKDNSLGEKGIVKSPEMQSFLTIAFNEGESSLRNKLLNQIVQKYFDPEKNDLVLRPNEELDGLELSDREFLVYREKEKMMAKVVVSFLERTEIYFVSRGVKVESLINQLALQSEGGRIFKWVTLKAPLTAEGETLYLLNLNHEDLMRNDFNFFQEKFDYKDLSQSKRLEIDTGKEFEVVVNFNQEKEQLREQVYLGRKVKCNRELLEAGMCGECSYKKMVPSDSFAKVAEPKLDELGIIIAFNGENFFFSEFSDAKYSQSQWRWRSKNHFSVNQLKSNTLLIEKSLPPAYVKYTPGYAHTPLCVGNEGASEIKLRSRVELNIEVKLYGRGEILKSIKL